MEKKCSIFVVKWLHFSNFMDLIWTWTVPLKKIWTVVGLGLSLKNQDWIWITKFDSLPISAGR